MNPPTNSERKRKFWGNMIWISAIVLVISICGGVAAVLIGMSGAFEKLQTAGSADPSSLAGNISNVLMASLISVPFAMVSLILFIIAIVKHRKLSNPNQAG